MDSNCRSVYHTLYSLRTFFHTVEAFRWRNIVQRESSEAEREKIAASFRVFRVSFNAFFIFSA